jgi:signal transduction histidine kinase
MQPWEAGAGDVAPRTTDYRRLVESLRVMLAIIAGLLMLDAQPNMQASLSVAVIAFSVYAIILFWQAANGSPSIHARIFHWLDALWFLLLLALAGEERTHYFLFLFFPIFFAAWRSGYRESIAIAAFSGLASLIVFALRDPGISWARILVLPLSLFVVGPLFVALARVEAATRNSLAFAANIVESLDPRRGFDIIIPDLIASIAGQMGATAAVLALRTFEGRSRVFCWEIDDGSSELSESAAPPMVEKALSLGSEAANGWSAARRWWERDRLIGIGPSGLPVSPGPTDRETLVALAELVGKPRLMSVPLFSPGVGRMRLLLAGESIEVNARSLEILVHIVEQVGPSVENAYLRERLATEAADTERARIGRDLHDSAIQPYIGLKFALEAVQRRAGPDNPVAQDLAGLVDMASEEVTAMREVIAGLRGAPGKGGALLSSAVRRQAQRFGQLFGIRIEVEVEGDMPVSRRIAGEMFHIVAEGLSNIRRHTRARRAWISLSATDGLLVLNIRNSNDAQAASVPEFTPRSLSERAAALGGAVEVACDRSSTTVTVRVPMPEATAKDHR